MDERSNRESHQLHHTPALLYLGIGEAAFCLGLALITNLFPNPTVTVWTTLGFITFALLGVCLIVLYFRNWHAISPKGLNYAGLLAGRGEMAWKDVTSLRYDGGGWHWFVVRSSSGQTAYVSAMLLGLPEFARLVLEYVPRANIETRTQSLLEMLAA